MDLTVLAIVLLLFDAIPLRNKIYKERKRKDNDTARKKLYALRSIKEEIQE